MTQWLEKLNKGVDFVINIVFAVMIAIVFLSAIARTLDISITWSIDVSLLLFAWFVFLSVSLASFRKSHVRMEILLEKMPMKWRKWVELLHSILAVLFLGIMLYYVTQYSISNSMMTITSLGISFLWIYVAGIVGFFLMLLYETIHLVQNLKNCIVKRD